MNKAIRKALGELRREFDRALRFHGPLHHQCLDTLFSSATMTTELWDHFIEDNRDPTVSELWRIDESANTCHHFTGSESGFAEFQRLGESLYLAMCEIESTLDPCRGFWGFIDVLHDTARDWPTPLLREQARLWKYGSGELPGPDEFEEVVDRRAGDNLTGYIFHPYCRSLVHNVFTSAIALIDVMTDFEGTLLVGDIIDLPPVMIDEPTTLYSLDVDTPFDTDDEFSCAFQKEVELRRIGYDISEDGPFFTIRNRVGMDRIAILIENEGKELRPMDLISGSTPSRMALKGEVSSTMGSHQELIDREGTIRTFYRHP